MACMESSEVGVSANLAFLNVGEVEIAAARSASGFEEEGALATEEEEAAVSSDACVPFSSRLRFFAFSVELMNGEEGMAEVLLLAAVVVVLMLWLGERDGRVREICFVYSLSGMRSKMWSMIKLIK